MQAFVWPTQFVNFKTEAQQKSQTVRAYYYYYRNHSLCLEQKLRVSAVFQSEPCKDMSSSLILIVVSASTHHAAIRRNMLHDRRANGMEVGLGLGHIVLDGDPAPRPKKGHRPHF